MAKEAKIEQWKASSDGPPWTHTIGSHASAAKTAREMRNDGFTGVRVDRYEPVDAESLLVWRAQCKTD
jgi:hypothetical protein